MISRPYAIRLLALEIADLREHCDSKEKSLTATIYEHIHHQLVQGVSRDGLLALLAQTRLIIRDTPNVHMAQTRDKALAEMQHLLQDLDEEIRAGGIDAQTISRFRSDTSVAANQPIITPFGRIQPGDKATVRAVLPVSNLVVASFVIGQVAVPAHVLNALWP